MLFAFVCNFATVADNEVLVSISWMFTGLKLLLHLFSHEQSFDHYVKFYSYFS